VLDLTGAASTTADWQSAFYETACAKAFNSYMRDLDFSPDGSFFVVATTGAHSQVPVADFGDGTTATGSTASHVYDAPATGEVTLRGHRQRQRLRHEVQVGQGHAGHRRVRRRCQHQRQPSLTRSRGPAQRRLATPCSSCVDEDRHPGGPGSRAAVSAPGGQGLGHRLVSPRRRAGQCGPVRWVPARARSAPT
jgi:hypothetical protein